MVWKDAYLNKIYSFPRMFFYLPLCIASAVSYMSLRNSFTHTNLQDKVFSVVTLILFVSYGATMLFVLLKGRELIQTIEDNGEYFIITNIFGESINITALDINTVKSAKFSAINSFFTGFPKNKPGLYLLLKNGKKYQISSRIENINSLKESLKNRN